MTHDEKAILRRAALRARGGCDPAVGMHLVAHLLPHVSRLLASGVAVAGFWPMAGEIDVRPLLLALIGRGVPVLLPETPPLGEKLRFRHWRPGVRMIVERFGTMRPEGPLGVPALLLVPLVAFDARCNRLGHGGGYYDRTLQALGPGVVAIGCGFAAQQVDAVPVLPHDAPLDAVATERGVLFRSL